MNDLKSAIESLYDTFAVYSGANNQHCTCGCIKEEHVQMLHSKPLRQLEPEDLVSFHGSALYTWGEVEHYKHYLPRFLELISVTRNGVYVTVDEVYSKLDYATWREWPIVEQKAITDWALNDWVALSNGRDSEISDAEIYAYSEFLGLSEMLRLWEVTSSEHAVRNFVTFFYHSGNQILNGGSRPGDKKYEIAFSEWLQRPDLIPALESHFFNSEKRDPEHAEKVSIVLQMVEQQMQAMKLQPSKPDNHSSKPINDI